jgi:hypothetical protein
MIGSSRKFGLFNLISPMLLGCSKTGATVTTVLYARGAKYSLKIYKVNLFNITDR